MKHDIAKLVRFGRGGDTVYFGGGSRSEGYGSPERPHAATVRPDRLIPDGTPVVDVRAAVVTPEGFQWVFRGPMLNPDLPDGEVSELGDPGIMAAALAGSQYGDLLAIHVTDKKPGTAGPLDYVGIAQYVKGWREHGARIGHYLNGTIQWEDEPAH